MKVQFKTLVHLITSLIFIRCGRRIQCLSDDWLLSRLQVRAATIMRRIIPHNSAKSQLNLSPHNSSHNWTKLTSDAAYFGEMEMRDYNTWLFPEVATPCLHQIKSHKAINDSKRVKFDQKFQFPFDNTLHQLDFIVSDSTDSEPEIVKPSPVRAHANFFVAQRLKKMKARSIVFNRRRNTCQATPKCGFLRRKRQIILQILFHSNGSFPAICLVFEPQNCSEVPHKTKLQR